MKKCTDIYMQPQRNSRQQLQMQSDPGYTAVPGVSTGDVWEGDGTPLQYSCLENPMGGGAR